MLTHWLQKPMLVHGRACAGRNISGPDMPKHAERTLISYVTGKACGVFAAAIASFAMAVPLAVEAVAQDRPFYDQADPYGDSQRQAPASLGARRPDDSYRPPQDYTAPSGGFGQQAGPDGRPVDQSRTYAPPPAAAGSGGYAGASGYDPRYSQPSGQYGAGAPPAQPGYGSTAQNDAWRGGGDAAGRRGGVYRPDDAPETYNDPRGGGDPRFGNDPRYGSGPTPGFQPQPQPGYAAPGSGYGEPNASSPSDKGFARPYGQPDGQPDGRGGPPGERYGANDQQRWDDRDRRGSGTYSRNEVVDTGHRFFGSISQGLARAVERVFRSQGRPNGYILGEDAGGAFVAGLRYGEGMLYTKDVGNHGVFWQGPSLGYDFGGEGSKAMVLVYNLRDPADIYERFGGVQGAAYVIGGVSVQFQTHGHVTLAVIRSGVGLRLGANVGYLKYTRRPTWNPF